MKNLLLLFAAISLVFCEEKVSYRGYKGLAIITPDEESVALVDGFKELKGVKVLHEPSTKRPCEIAVPTDQYNQIIQTLTQKNLHYTILYDDLQAIIDEQIKESRRNNKLARFRSGSRADDSIATYFPTYKQANDWLSHLHRKYSDLTEVISIGKSYQGRDQVVIKIGTKREGKKVVWIDAAIHAREWATVPTALYVATKLLADYASGETKELLDTYDFYILPVFNPDGYVHSHNVDRMWRKNRRPHELPGRCPGVDLNRNFGYEWGLTGVSRRSCDDAYLGPSPFSEPETRNVRDKLLEFEGRFQMYLNLHAYGELWFVPYGHHSEYQYDDMANHYRVAKAATRAIFYTSMRHTRYSIGKPGELLYNAAGGTFDWAHAVAGAKYAFAAELSPKYYYGIGRRGFEISPNQVLPIAQEIYNGVKAAINAM